jgi:hypothetical protein
VKGNFMMKDLKGGKITGDICNTIPSTKSKPKPKPKPKSKPKPKPNPTTPKKYYVDKTRFPKTPSHQPTNTAKINSIQNQLLGSRSRHPKPALMSSAEILKT